MKLYLCTWITNYGLNCCVISAKDEQSANILANGYGAWPGFELNEIISSNEEEVLSIDFYNGG